MKKRKLLVMALTFTMISAQALTVSAHEKTYKTTTEKKLEAAQSEQKSNQQTAADAAKAVTAKENEKKAITSKLSDQQAQLVVTTTAVNDINTEVENKTKEVEETTQKLADATETLQTQKEAMAKRIQYMYENGIGGDDVATTVASGDNVSDAINQTENIQEMYSYDRESLKEYNETVQTVTDLKEKQEEQKADLEDAKADLEEEKAAQEAAIEETKKASANADAEIKEAQETAAKYQAVVEEQNEQIAKLAKAQKAEAAAQGEAAKKAAAEAKATALSSSDSSTGQAICNYALQFVGNPYVYGGNSLTNGIDCSGFVQQVLANFGISCPRSSSAIRSAGTEVSYADAQPGDVICYEGHVAIYLGNGQIVHASNSKPYPQGGIKVSSNAAYRTILSVRRFV